MRNTQEKHLRHTQAKPFETHTRKTFVKRSRKN